MPPLMLHDSAPARQGVCATPPRAPLAAVRDKLRLEARHVPPAVRLPHGRLLALSALAGGVLLAAADVAARSVIAPRELPVGLLTAVLGGAYLLALLRRRGAP